MTASLFTFTLFDGTLLEVNSDQINYFIPSTVGATAATIINVGPNVQFTVVNTLSQIGSVLPSTGVPLPFNPPIPIIYPVVKGSAQLQHFSFRERDLKEYRSFEGWYALELIGKDAMIRSSQEWPRDMSVFAIEPYPYRSWEWSYQREELIGKDVLPFRNSQDITYTQFFDYSNNINLLAAGIPM